MRIRSAEAGIAAALALAAVAAALLVPTYPNYDAYYHLVWGRELLDGTRPSFEAYQAPTQHPLYLALCAALVPLGTRADRALVLVCVVSLVALVWAVYRVGDAVFGRWPALAAAAFTGSSFAFLLYAARAYVDVPFLALVLWAAALEARRPRSGRPVMALLALAGLLRPEAWVLAGAYWLWSGPRRLDLLAMAAAAPVAWALVDLAVTGDPLHSLHATSDLADELGRERGVGRVPAAFVTYLAETARPPVALAALAGAALAWRLRAGRSLHVVAGLLAAGALTFLATGIAGLSILPRYLTVPVIGLCLLAGYGVLGFTTLPRGSSARRAWSRAAAVLAVLGLAFAVARVGVVERLASELRFIRGTHDDLVAVLRTPAVQRDLRCGALTFPNYRLVPDARWILDLPRERVGARSALRRSRGVAIFVLGEKALRRYGFADGASPSTNVPDPGFEPISRRGRFVAYAACPARATAARAP
jgi:Dolichyl-phosphate-mannose-protein mannosyltransferase